MSTGQKWALIATAGLAVAVLYALSKRQSAPLECPNQSSTSSTCTSSERSTPAPYVAQERVEPKPETVMESVAAPATPQRVMSGRAQVPASPAPEMEMTITPAPPSTPAKTSEPTPSTTSTTHMSPQLKKVVSPGTSSANLKGPKYMLKIKVKCCRLAVPDPNLKDKVFPDCYIIFNVFDKTKKRPRWTEETRVAPTSDVPIWNQAFTVPKIVLPDDYLVFTLIQKKTLLPNEYLGQCMFDLTLLEGCEGGDYTLNIDPIEVVPADLRGGFGGRSRAFVEDLIKKNAETKNHPSSNQCLSFEVLFQNDSSVNDVRLNVKMARDEESTVTFEINNNPSGSKTRLVTSDI
eukprot:TRINITY_DN8610_c0_g1::TRINITY_DN8610_c0_g1_i1::g.8504::m.8504 TRINITY_DN8610_c0_g1::TRINITY_DN8610_c0_g1_i1::g.8504  ORF type:complete len:368 (+),score=63.09,C2/PF00168.25/2.5e-06,C2/PF00168.25/3.1e+03 TRINITY_DN8610_c0_g1_i1:62-1105(+)